MNVNVSGIAIFNIYVKVQESAGWWNKSQNCLCERKQVKNFN